MEQFDILRPPPPWLPEVYFFSIILLPLYRIINPKDWSSLIRKSLGKFPPDAQSMCRITQQVMCIAREGQNSFPKAWSSPPPPKKREESLDSNDWSSHFIIPHTSRALEVSSITQKWHGAECCPALFVCQWNSTPTDRSCQHPGLPTWASRLRGHRVRYVAWRCAGAGLRLQRGQQPGRALSVTAWPPVCLGKTNPILWGLA